MVIHAEGYTNDKGILKWLFEQKEYESIKEY